MDTSKSPNVIQKSTDLSNDISDDEYNRAVDEENREMDQRSLLDRLMAQRSLLDRLDRIESRLDAIERRISKHENDD